MASGMESGEEVEGGRRGERAKARWVRFGKSGRGCGGWGVDKDVDVDVDVGRLVCVIVMGSGESGSSLPLSCWCLCSRKGGSSSSGIGNSDKSNLIPIFNVSRSRKFRPRLISALAASSGCMVCGCRSRLR